MNETSRPGTPDFSDPLGALHACHQDMLAQCQALEQLVTHLQDQGFDAEARTATARAVQFFTTTAVHHHQDEEVDLFPVLNRQSLKLADVVHRLRKDHEQLRALWDRLLTDLKRGPALVEDSAFAERVRAFCNAYREHIAREEKELFSLAQHILSHRQLEDIGRAMARRRGIRR
ncbi:MAG: hemerythrin domain-containing protein [Gammaproteobacteria bacterium]|jgi:hemerythrin-like domain-containing protein